MKIFLLSQDVNNGWDTYDDCIVIAEDEKDAIKMHPDGEYDYPEKDSGDADRNYGTWAKKEFVKVEYIGEAKEESEKGVICSSFHAG